MTDSLQFEGLTLSEQRVIDSHRHYITDGQGQSVIETNPCCHSCQEKLALARPLHSARLELRRLNAEKDAAVRLYNAIKPMYLSDGTPGATLLNAFKREIVDELTAAFNAVRGTHNDPQD